MTNIYTKQPVQKAFLAGLAFLLAQILVFPTATAKERPATPGPQAKAQESHSSKRTAGPTSWVVQNSGFDVINKGIRSMDAVDENVVWAVAYDATPGRTTDTYEFTRTVNGGTTWTKGSIGSDPTTIITNISAVSATQAWAGLWAPSSTGSRGVYHTTDGGQTWARQTTARYDSAASFINWVSFADANNGATGGDPVDGYFEIYTTSNGGQTWTQVPKANIPASLPGEYGISDDFTRNGNNLWFGTTRGRVFRSADNGVTWTVSAPFEENVSVYYMAFANNGSGIVVGVESGTNYLVVNRTSNNGNNWLGVRYELLGGISPNDIAYVPGTISTFVVSGSRANMLGTAYTRDAGETWTTIDNDIQHLEVDFVSPTTGWTGAFSKANGAGGMYKFSGNLAATPSGEPLSWTEKTNGFTIPSRGIRTIHALNENVVWAVTYDGGGGVNPLTAPEFVRTADGGNTWVIGQITGLPSGSGIGNIAAVSAMEAFASVYGPPGTPGVYHTTNGGQTWTRQATATFNASTSFPAFVTFSNTTNGVVVGDPVDGSFEVYTTANGGQAWTRLPKANMPASLNNEYGITDDFTRNGNNVWFGTSHGRIFKSTNNGLNWTVSTPFADTVLVSEMAFADNGTGIAIGIENKTNYILLSRTTDGGTTWSSPVYRLPGAISPNSIAYVPGTTQTFVVSGARAGMSGTAYTTDGGLTWTLLDQNVQHLQVAFTSPTNGWSGGFSKMYKFSGSLAGTLTGLAEEMKARPVQAYPNPATTEFAITTTITAKDAKVQLYNMRGQLVLEQALPAAGETVNVGHLPKGVYVLHLVEPKKVVKQKIIIQ